MKNYRIQIYSITLGGEFPPVVYGCFDSIYGRFLLVCTKDEKIAGLIFGVSDEQNLKEITTILNVKGITEDSIFVSSIAERIFSPNDNIADEFEVIVQTTGFRLSVWKELIQIPYAQLRSYSDIAKSIGSPTAVRAVATAIAQNHIAVLIPCHRVISKSGEINNYRWGIDIKKMLIENEKKK